MSRRFGRSCDAGCDLERLPRIVAVVLLTLAVGTATARAGEPAAPDEESSRAEHEPGRDAEQRAPARGFGRIGDAFARLRGGFGRTAPAPEVHEDLGPLPDDVPERFPHRLEGGGHDTRAVFRSADSRWVLKELKRPARAELYVRAIRILQAEGVPIPATYLGRKPGEIIQVFADGRPLTALHGAARERARAARRAEVDRIDRILASHPDRSIRKLLADPDRFQENFLFDATGRLTWVIDPVM